VTHALILLDSKGQFTLNDYDQNQVTRLQDTWHGLPLSRLPELLLGITSLPENGVVSSAHDDSFEVRLGNRRFLYLMRWIDPGPRLALSGIEGENSEGKKYTVHYSHFMDKQDFYLPQEVQISGDIELKITWRERSWNEQIPARVFMK